MLLTDLLMAGHSPRRKILPTRWKLSPRTGEVYRGGLLHKMHVRNAAELMRQVFINREPATFSIFKP